MNVCYSRGKDLSRKRSGNDEAKIVDASRRLIGFVWDSVAVDIGVCIVTYAVAVDITRLRTVPRESILGISDAVTINISVCVVAYPVAVRVDGFVRVVRECVIRVKNPVAIRVNIAFVGFAVVGDCFTVDDRFGCLLYTSDAADD